MAELELKENSLGYYFGWYGSCETNTPCDSFSLNDDKSIYDKIHKVLQINKTNSGFSLFDGTQSIDDELAQANQDFTKLECGKCYLIILNDGAGTLNIPSFVTEGGNLRKGCFNFEQLKSVALTQSPNTEKKYFGWFGTCTNGITEFDLTNKNVREKIKSVIRVNKTNDNYDSFISDVNPSHDKYQDFTKLESGNPYFITLNKGKSDLGELKNFIYTDVDSSGIGFVVNDCDRINTEQLKSQEIKLSSSGINVSSATWKNINAETKVNSFNVLYEDDGNNSYAYFDGKRGGCVKVPYKTYAQEISVGLKFKLSSTESSVIDSPKGVQYLLFQENNRVDNKNGAFYALFKKKSDTSGYLKIGTYNDNGYGSNVSYEISVDKDYHVFFVLLKNKIKLYVNGKYISESTKAVGIDYNTKNTINIGRKFATGNNSDAFFSGKIYEFSLYSEELSGETIKNISEIN